MFTQAVRTQSLSELKRLLDLGYLPDAPSSGNPMMLAIVTGQLAMVTMLLEYGASPDKDGALKKACSTKPHNIAIIRKLLYHGANPDGLDARSGKVSEIPLLQDVIIAGEVEIAKLLIEYGASIKRCNLDIILKSMVNNHCSSEQERKEQDACVKLLLSHFPPQSAVRQILCNEVFTSSATRLTFANKEQSLLTLFTVIRKGDISAIDSLVACGVDVNARGDAVLGRNITPLQVAANDGNVAVIDRLVNHGANVNAVGNCNQTALHLAAARGHAAASDYLMKHGANVNARNSNNHTPLHLAAIAAGNVDVLDSLMRHGADISAKDSSGYTALHKAAERANSVANSVPFINRLVEYGADVHARTEHGLTPARCCLSCGVGNRDILNVLKAYEIQYPPGPRPSAIPIINSPNEPLFNQTKQPLALSSSGSSQSIAPSITSTNSYGKAPSPIQPSVFISNIQNSSISQLSSESQKRGIIFCSKTPSVSSSSSQSVELSSKSSSQFFSAIPVKETYQSYDYTLPPQLDEEVILQARVIATYKAQKNEELTVIKGDIVSVIERKPSGWWFCQYNGKQGFVPGNRLSLEEETLSTSSTHKFETKF